MKLLRTRRRRLAALITTLALVLAAGGIAAAYFVSHATGTGSAPAPIGAAPAAQTMTVTVNPPTTAMTPGGAAEPFSFRIANPTPASPSQVSSVTAAVTSTSASGCLASWFQVNPSGLINTGTAAAVALPVLLNSAMPSIDSSGWTVQMVDSGTDQTACAGGSVTITVTVS